MTNEFSIRVWRPGAREPAKGVTVSSTVALDRELLCVTDGTISRTTNAPKLTPATPAIFELEVPTQCARPVLVIEGMRFEGLQHGVPPASEPWKIAPGQLGRSERITLGGAASVALVQQLDWDRLGPTHHLLPLPSARQVRPGETMRVIAPALLVVGEGAADVTAADTVVPGTIPRDQDRVSSFRLADAEALLEPLDRLDAFANPLELGSLHAPGSAEPILASELTRVAHGWLNRGARPHVFFPLLEEGRPPRLALAYRRNDGTAGVIVSSPQPERWLDELIAYLKSPAARVAKSLSAPTRSPSPSPSPRATPRPNAAAAPEREPIACFGIETRNARFGKVLNDLAHIAETDLSVLMLGESGTGKEFLAQAVHAASARRRGPFVAVNCSAIADALIESELFGHRRGAFTGAQTERAGAFASAHGGTLLLDEIGDAPARVQFALLRALESRTVKAVGSDSERAVDVRVIAATSRDLHALMEQGSFRSDLYYRLAQLSITLPPLRDRLEDLPALATQLLERELPGATLSDQAMALLERHAWPGNVRELRNVLKRAVALSRGAKTLQIVHFAQLTELDLTTLPPPAPPVARELVFPPHVTAQADRMWKDGQLAAADSSSRLEHRAAQRAALLCLAVQRPFTSWPKALSQQWHRLFGDKWATTEEARGLRDVLRELGLDPRDAAIRGMVVELVERRGGA